MSKYESMKFLKATKARTSHMCEVCNQKIGRGEIYYKESIEKVNTLGMKLRGFCQKCYQEYGHNLGKITED